MLANAKHEAFCLEYMKDRIAGAAYVRAGYARKGADQNAARLIRNDKVAARLRCLEAEFAERAKIEIDDLLARYIQIATADRNELMSIEVGACRYCYGVDHAYQWRTTHEYQAALNAWHMLPENKQSVVTPPEKDGGYGYKANIAPNPCCPMCDDRGHARAIIRDTTRLSADAQAIYIGVKQTRYGARIKTLRADRALYRIAQILGAFEKRDRRKSDVNASWDNFIKEVNLGEPKIRSANVGTPR